MEIIKTKNMERVTVMFTKLRIMTTVQFMLLDSRKIEK